MNFLLIPQRRNDEQLKYFFISLKGNIEKKLIYLAINFLLRNLFDNNRFLFSSLFHALQKETAKKISSTEHKNHNENSFTFNSFMFLLHIDVF